MAPDVLVPGLRIGRLKVVAATADKLVLAGSMVTAILLLLAGLLLGVWAALLWVAVVNGTGPFKFALVVSFLAGAALWMGAATLGARYCFDGVSRTLVHSQFFGLRTTTRQAPALRFVSIRTNPASARVRECAWLHLMDERELVTVYLAKVQTQSASSAALVAAAARIAELLDLSTRCEGAPMAGSSAFRAAFDEYVAQCPQGVQPLRERIA